MKISKKLIIANENKLFSADSTKTFNFSQFKFVANFKKVTFVT